MDSPTSNSAENSPVSSQSPGPGLSGATGLRPRSSPDGAVDPRIKQKGLGKTARIPIKIVPIEQALRKPE